MTQEHFPEFFEQAPTLISTTSCIQKLLVATSFSEITMISADKIKSVVIAPRTNVFSSFAAAFSSASSL